jgi:hypothetical protein
VPTRSCGIWNMETKEWIFSISFPALFLLRWGNESVEHDTCRKEGLTYCCCSLIGYNRHHTTTNWSIEWKIRGLSKRGRRMWEYIVKKKFFFLNGIRCDQERDENSKVKRACSYLHTMIMNMKWFCGVIKWQYIVNDCIFLPNNWRSSTAIVRKGTVRKLTN